MLPTAVSAVKQLITCLRQYRDPDNVDSIAREVSADLKAHQKRVRKLALGYGELDEADKAASKAADKTNRKWATKTFSQTLQAAVKSLDDSEGIKKLEATQKELEIKERFNLVAEPIVLSGNHVELYDKLGVPETLRGATYAARLISQWNEHRAAFKPLAEGSPIPTPKAVFDYWASIAGTSPELSVLALLHWVRPVSSASVERIYSLLTEMDSSRRQTMQRETMYNTLFLRGNWRVVQMLMSEMVAERAPKEAPGGARAEASRKRMREGSAAAMDALRSQHAGSTSSESEEELEL
jgi:hypothetical protein